MAGQVIATGNNCVQIGSSSGGISGGDNQICIGYQATSTAANECVIGGSSITHIRNSGHNTCDIGSATMRFKNGYFAGNLFSDTINTNDLSVKSIATSTDNAIPRYDGTVGKSIQNSGVIIDDSNNITGVSP